MDFDRLEALMQEGMKQALNAAALVATDEMRRIAPRDLTTPRLPQNIDRKDGKKPHRSRRGVVNYGGHWYEGVTGNLKQSIGINPRGLSVEVGTVKNGPAANYAAYLEDGTPHMRPRPFVGVTLQDPAVGKEMLRQAQLAFDHIISKF